MPSCRIVPLPPRDGLLQNMTPDIHPRDEVVVLTIVSQTRFGVSASIYSRHVLTTLPGTVIGGRPSILNIANVNVPSARSKQPA